MYTLAFSPAATASTRLLKSKRVSPPRLPAAPAPASVAGVPGAGGTAVAGGAPPGALPAGGSAAGGTAAASPRFGLAGCATGRPSAARGGVGGVTGVKDGEGILVKNNVYRIRAHNRGFR